MQQSIFVSPSARDGETSTVSFNGVPPAVFLPVCVRVFDFDGVRARTITSHGSPPLLRSLAQRHGGRRAHAPTVLFLYPFRFHDPLSHRWVKARYKAERHELVARYAEWEIIGEPELRWPQEGSESFTPWRSA